MTVFFWTRYASWRVRQPRPYVPLRIEGPKKAGVRKKAQKKGRQTFRILIPKKLLNIPLHLHPLKLAQHILKIPIRNHHPPRHLRLDRLPMPLDILPQRIPRLRIRRQRDTARMQILHGDFIRELEVQEILREVGGLHAAHGLQADFAAVDGGCGVVFVFEGCVGGFAAFGDGDAEDGEAEGGVDCGGVAREVGLEFGLGGFNCSEID